MKKMLSGKMRWLILGVLILAIAGGGAFYYVRTTKAKAAAAATQIKPLQTAKAFRGNIVLTASGTGTLAAANTSNFGFGTSGQIKELDVKIGDTVKAGQVIGKLDDSDAQTAYDQAKRNLADLSTPAAIAAAEQSVADAQVAITNAYQALQHLVSPDVMYWENQVTSAQDALQKAQTNGGTNPTADQKKAIDNATAALNKAQTNLQAAHLAYVNTYAPDNFTYTVTDSTTGKTHTEVVPPSDAEIAGAKATYQLAIEKQKEAQAYLDLLNGKASPQDVPGSSITSLVEAQTALQTAENNLKATQLISPISGTVTALTASVGDLVSTSSIITVADLSQPYTIDTYFDAEDWSSVQVGYEAQVVFDILPDNTYTGKVTLVYPALDTSSNSSLVHATIKLDQKVNQPLPSGSSASVDVISGKASNAVLVPVEALHKLEDGRYTAFLMQNGSPRLKVVDVGLQDITYAEIKSGINAGDVVTTGIVETQ